MAPLLFYLIISVYFCPAQGNEYIYPKIGVSSHDSNALNLYVMCQKNRNEFSLLVWNINTNQLFNALPFYFSPLDVVLLPYEHGISFIDQGRIRIKNFGRRSVKAIDIDFPLKNPIKHVWLSPQRILICAEYCNTYGLFIVDSYGSLMCSTHDNNLHYILPCFNATANKVCYVSYGENGYLFHESDLAFNNNCSYALSKDPIYVVPLCNGYLIISIDSCTQEYMTCIGTFIMQEGRALQGRNLFTFKIKKEFIDPETMHCYVEHYLPFMPSIDEDRELVYYTNYDPGLDKTSIITHHIPTNTIYSTHSPSETGSHYYAPICANGKLFYGITSAKGDGKIEMLT